MSPPRTTEITVWCATHGQSVPVGTAWVSQRRGTVSTTFTYDPGWQADRSAHAFSPELNVTTARHHLARLPGALADCSPDRWGRTLIDKRLRGQARLAGGVPAQLTEVDYLLGVSDLTRQGALRLTTEVDGPFLAEHAEVPQLVELPRLLRAADAVGVDDDAMAAVKALLDAGSGSLGGARPKASVRDGDHLAIAKFPHRSDDWDVMAWEKTALDLAERAGIRVPVRRLVDIDARHALVLDRFDRTSTGRVEYISAMTLVGGHDGGTYDYLEVAEALAERGVSVAADLAELWRRIAFSLLVNNTDDHLRNHGMLHHINGWRLSPAFDVNPNPDTHAQRATTVCFAAGDRSQSLSALIDGCDEFGLTPAAAAASLREVAAALVGWRDVAADNGVTKPEVDLFADCFDGLLRDLP